ncbi:phospholipase D-like domain-containing protein [Evansella halocellulosilytica]|uniref:phospholipase D-like domain-containing protein n=1 Tax=Evansella halocellulosilytica TaxID=2011013 RepID=UPI000BB7AA11|nr:phospholipase D-like domain-containing protein [Evansella halocellulosilytica]
MLQKNKILPAFLLMLFFLIPPVLSSSAFLVGEAYDATNVIITEVYYDTHVSFEPDEFIAVTNPLDEDIDLSSWSIGDLNTEAVFPDGTFIEGGETLYIVRDADVAIEHNILNGMMPDFEFSENTVSDVPNLEGSNPRFANNGDEVVLRDNEGEKIDIVIYGNSDYSGDGWTSDPVPTGSSGDLLVRNRDEVTGVWIDTDSRSDWDSLKTNPLAVTDDLRTYKQAQSRFELETFEFEGTVRPYTSPDSTYEVLSSLIDSAQESIDLSVYEMHSPHLTEHLVEAIERGVEVRTHFDGGPVGGLQDESRWVSQQIYEAGGEVRYIVMDRDNDIHKRYRWDHSKYGIIDGETLFVQSENWKSSGTPVDSSFGNRGWGIVIENEDVANYYLDVFETDWDDNFPDIFAHTPSHDRWGDPSNDFEPEFEITTGSYEAPFESEEVSGAFSVSPVIAPDTSFRQQDSILGMINSAEEYVFVDQMYSHKFWGGQDDSSESHPNIYMEAVIDAAKNGASVRFSLGDAWLDPDNRRDNINTIDYLNGIADEYDLDMEAKLINTDALGIEITHNKGVIVDDQVLVSSINWSKNSGKNNREAGVIIQNQEVADFYKEVFLYDWYGGEEAEFEDFEGATKGSYAAGDVELATGSWHFDNALLGARSSDKSFGNRSARIRSEGSVSMNFDLPAAAEVSFYHANFGSDSGGEITLQKSFDQGSSWCDVEGPFTSQNDLEKVTVDMDVSEDVRFRLLVSGTSGVRINIDNFTIVH